eukprot:365043-Chlamydomonas_euryale.AAC.14
MEFYLVGLMNAGQLGFCPPLANCRDSVLLCCSFAAINTSNLYERSTLAIYSSMWLSSDAGSHLCKHTNVRKVMQVNHGTMICPCWGIDMSLHPLG